MKTLLDRLSFLFFLFKAYLANSKAFIYHNFLNSGFLTNCKQVSIADYIQYLYAKKSEEYLKGIFDRFFASFSVIGFISLLDALNQAKQTPLWLCIFLTVGIWRILRHSPNSFIKLISWAAYLGFLGVFYNEFPGIPKHVYLICAIVLYVLVRPLVDFVLTLIVFFFLKSYFWWINKS